MEPEICFALLSRRSDFPVAVPRCYFADYHAQTQSDILITERIAYGSPPIEPCWPKAMDYALPNAFDHYAARWSVRLYNWLATIARGKWDRQSMMLFRLIHPKSIPARESL